MLMKNKKIRLEMLVKILFSVVCILSCIGTFLPEPQLFVGLITAELTIVAAYLIFISEFSIRTSLRKKDEKILVKNWLTELDTNAKYIQEYCDLFKKFVINGQKVIENITSAKVKDPHDVIEFYERNKFLLDKIDDFLDQKRYELNKDYYLGPSLAYYFPQDRITLLTLEKITLRKSCMSSMYTIIKLNGLFKTQTFLAIKFLKDYVLLENKTEFSDENRFTLFYFLKNQLPLFGYLTEYMEQLSIIANNYEQEVNEAKFEFLQRYLA
jgi:hypothetical protein